MVIVDESINTDREVTMDTLQRAVGMIESRAQQSGLRPSAEPVVISVEDKGDTLRLSKRYKGATD